jgi:hypothetical protein
MLKAGEVFEIAMLAHGSLPWVRNAARCRAGLIAYTSSFRKPRSGRPESIPPVPVFKTGLGHCKNMTTGVMDSGPTPRGVSRNDEERPHFTLITTIASTATMNSICSNCFAVAGLVSQR